MPMNIHAILDLDGVMYPLVRRYCQGLDARDGGSREADMGDRPNLYAFWQELGLSKVEFFDFLAEGFRTGLFAEGEPLKGAVEGFAHLGRIGGVTRHVITRRGISGCEMEATHCTQTWLRENGLKPESLSIVGSESKPDVALAKLDLETTTVIAVDDSPSELEAYASAGLRAVALDYPFNQDWSGERVGCLEEFAALVADIRECDSATC